MVCAAARAARRPPLRAPWNTLIVSPVFPPSIVNGGGVSITLDALSRRLTARGGSVDVLSPAIGNLDAYEQAWYPGFRHIFPGVRNMARIWAAVRRADVVVAPDSTLVPYVALMCRLLRTPMMYQVHTDVACLLRGGHGHGCCDGSGALSGRCIARIVDVWFALGSRLATRTLTTSPSYARLVRRRGYVVAGAFSPRIKTAIFEVDDAAEDVAAARAWLSGGRPDRLLLLHVSRLSPEKRIGLVVAAKPPGAILAIVGNGPQRDEIAAMHDEARGVVVHIGIVAQDRLRLLYKAADCLLSASAFETLGMTVMEAHLCGTPAVVERTCAPFVAQIVDEGPADGKLCNGALADFDDADAARATISALLARRLDPRDVARTVTVVAERASESAASREMATSPTSVTAPPTAGTAGTAGTAIGTATTAISTAAAASAATVWDAGLPALDDIVDEVATRGRERAAVHTAAGACAELGNAACVPVALLVWAMQMLLWLILRATGSTKKVSWSRNSSS